VHCCVPPGLSNYGYMHGGMSSFLFPSFSLLFPICARYFTSTSVLRVNFFGMNDLQTEGLGMELA